MNYFTVSKTEDGADAQQDELAIHDYHAVQA